MPDMQMPTQKIPDKSTSIYSKNAIFVFSCCFTTLFGGTLLLSNLYAINKRDKMLITFAVSYFYTFAALFALVEFHVPFGWWLVGYNVVGGLVLSQVLYKKFIGVEVLYSKKSVLVPFILSVCIVLPFLLQLINGGTSE